MANRTLKFGALQKPLPRVVDRRARTAAKALHRREVYAEVSARDRYRCVACKRVADPRALDMTRRGHHHHIAFRSRGGQDVSSNVALLCQACHADVHAYRLTITGNADGKLTIRRVE